MARAIVIRPRVLLFDEPLSNLDAKLRVQVRGEIRLYATRAHWSAGKVALSVYYLGVPDTTPEFVLEASMLSYLAAASSARR